MSSQYSGRFLKSNSLKKTAPQQEAKDQRGPRFAAAARSGRKQASNPRRTGFNEGEQFFTNKEPESVSEHGKLFSVLAVPALLITIAAAAALVLYVHPADAVVRKANTAKADLSASMEAVSAEASSDAVKNLVTINPIIPEPEEVVEEVVIEEPKVYKIADDALCGEVPNPDCYGHSSDPSVVEAVIASASDLLDGQSVAWNRDLPFLSGTETKWYLDDTILVLTWEESVDNATYYCSEVKIADPSQFRRMLSGNTYGASQQLKCSSMAAAANAVLASNADFYAFRVAGVNVYQGSLYRCVLGLDNCYVDADGNLLMSYSYELNSEEEVLQYIEDNNIRFSLSFGPVLVKDGVMNSSCDYSIGQPEQYVARSAIGQLGDLHYIIMNINYVQEITVAQAMARKGVINAYALDGGQTGETIFGGEIFNRIVYDSERNVSDIIYFATAYPYEEEEQP